MNEKSTFILLQLPLICLKENVYFFMVLVCFSLV